MWNLHKIFEFIIRIRTLLTCKFVKKKPNKNCVHCISDNPNIYLAEKRNDY